MRLKVKILLVTIITVTISLTIITTLTIVDIKKNAEHNILIYKQEEMEKIKLHIKDIVNISHEMLSVSYRNAQNMELIEKLYGNKLDGRSSEDKTFFYENVKQNIINTTIEDLKAIKHNNDGYIWIHDNTPPFVKIMHPIKPEEEGQIPSDTDQFIYRQFAEICDKDGEGFLTYDYLHPEKKIIAPKISYIRLFKQKNWVVGTGVYIDNIDTMVEEKRKAAQKQVNWLVTMIILVAGSLMIISSYLLIKFGDRITMAIFHIKTQLNDLARGRDVMPVSITRNDELGEMKRSVDQLIEGISAYSSFAIEIGKGNYDAKFNALSPDDKLGNSLLQMRESLQKAKNIAQQRKIEDDKLNWATIGIARFGDIMRQGGKNIEELAYVIIYNLIKYLDANLGGIYIYNDDENDDYLRLIASYALDRRKFQEKKILTGQGLVGACAYEHQTIFLKKLPPDYLKVVSGLGEAQPSCLLLVPLKNEERIMGVIEIASFRQLENHEIEFAEKVAQNIASTLSTAKINLKTKELLQESRIQSEMLEKQEQRMKVQLDELNLTQKKFKEIENTKDEEIRLLNLKIYRLQETIEKLSRNTDQNDFES